jgi:hypothetical protein
MLLRRLRVACNNKTYCGLHVLVQLLKEFYICGSVRHQSILLNNRRDAALSSRV